MRSRKGIALLALLATAEKGVRSRNWLQQKLWSTREVAQAQASLRRELANLRKLMGNELPWLTADHFSVGINLDLVEVDVRDRTEATGEFLEGVDIPGEEDFEDWLREMRSHYQHAFSPPPAPRHLPAVASMGNGAEAPSDQDELRSVLAILPVRGLFTREDQTPLLIGLTRLLVDGVARLRWLPVIAPETMHDANVVGASAGDVAQTLRARYLLLPEMVRADHRTMLNFTLLEMPMRRVLWSDSQGMEAEPDLEMLQSVILRAISILSDSIDRSEQIRSLEIEPTPVDLTNLMWRVRYHLNKFTREDMELGSRLLNEAQQINGYHPELAMLRAQHAIWSHRLHRAPIDKAQELLPLARTAMRADPMDARGPLFMGLLETWARRTENAVRHLEKSCDLNPSFAIAYVHLGTAHYLNGDCQRALQPLEMALHLSPMDPYRFFILGEMGTVKLLLGDYEGALRLAREVQMTHPNYVLAHILETDCLLALDDLPGAQRAWSRLLGKRPDLYEEALEWMPFREPAGIAALRQGCDLVAGHLQDRIALRA